MQNGQKRARTGLNASVCRVAVQGHTSCRHVSPFQETPAPELQDLPIYALCLWTSLCTGKALWERVTGQKQTNWRARSVRHKYFPRKKTSLTAQNYCFYGERLTFREASHLPENLISEGGGQMSTSVHNLADIPIPRFHVFHRDGSSHTQKNE